MISSEYQPAALAEKIRALADKREQQARLATKVAAQNLADAAKSYRALADAVERTGPPLRLVGAQHRLASVTRL